MTNNVKQNINKIRSDKMENNEWEKKVEKKEKEVMNEWMNEWTREIER